MASWAASEVLDRVVMRAVDGSVLDSLKCSCSVCFNLLGMANGSFEGLQMKFCMEM